MTPDPDEELDEILSKMLPDSFLPDGSFDELGDSIFVAIEAIKEWSCKHRECEYESYTKSAISIVQGRDLQEGIGPCIHCGKEKT